jgi:hypothetical protein
VTTTPTAPVTVIRTAVHRFPTSTPEADGTFAWDATTAVTVQVEAGGRTGPGWTYSSPAAAALIGSPTMPVSSRCWSTVLPRLPVARCAPATPPGTA